MGDERQTAGLPQDLRGNAFSLPRSGNLTGILQDDPQFPKRRTHPLPQRDSHLAISAVVGMILEVRAMLRQAERWLKLLPGLREETPCEARSGSKTFRYG